MCAWTVERRTHRAEEQSLACGDTESEISLQSEFFPETSFFGKTLLITPRAAYLDEFPTWHGKTTSKVWLFSHDCNQIFSYFGIF